MNDLQQSNSSEKSTQQEQSSDPLLLTPLEVESLRKHKKKISAQMRGRSKHLFLQRKGK